MEGGLGGCLGPGREREGRSIPRSASLMWTVGSCTLASLTSSGALDVKENEAEAWRDLVLCGSATGNRGGDRCWLDMIVPHSFLGIGENESRQSLVLHSASGL